MMQKYFLGSSKKVSLLPYYEFLSNFTLTACQYVKIWDVLPIWGQFVAFGLLHHLTTFEVKTQLLKYYRHRDPGKYFPQHYHVFTSPLSPSSNS